MIIFKKFADYQKYILEKKKAGDTIGFVPTMGALHEGHLSLIANSKWSTSMTVCSIFINPNQFNNKEDFNKYPVSIENDIYLLETHHCDVLLLPSVEEVYPVNYPIKHFELGAIEMILEGAFRPGHFQGVCQVVNRLLEQVKPNVLFLGRKDYQQCMVIRRLLEITNSPVQLQIAQTLREENGLAMSSRNLRLTEDERAISTIIYKALQYLKQHIVKGDTDQVRQHASDMISNAGLKTDYLIITNATDLTTVTNWDGTSPIVGLAAATINGVRLIDNLSLSK